MELMHQPLDKLHELVYEKLGLQIPESVVAKIAETVIKALHFLEELQVFHRGELHATIIYRRLCVNWNFAGIIKPSNIFFNFAGEIKLSDYGIKSAPTSSLGAKVVPIKEYSAVSNVWHL